MKRFILVIALMAALGASAIANAALPTVVLGPGLNSGRTDYFQSQTDRTLSADSLYILTGLYFVDSLKTLTIEPGTVIEGDTAATLIIRRGGKIYCNGEQFNPVVFTSRQPAGSREPGDWGGVVVLGNAPVNKVSPLIEGGIIQGTFGGTDSHDNSGVIKYTRIEYGGYRFQLDNEINGLTLGGVGDGTEIHHIQVSYSFDDSYECFGGTVSLSNLVAFGGTDDEFDSDFGFNGKMQFLFGLKDPDYWDPTGQSNGFESDNDGSGSGDVPLTAPVISNATLVGPERTNTYVPAPLVSSFENSAVIRRNTRLSLFNSVIMGYPWGVSLRDTGTKTGAADNTLDWQYVSIQATNNHGTTSGSCAPASTSHVHEESRWPCTDAVSPGVLNWFNGEPGNAGSSTRMPDDVKLTDMDNLNDPNPVPAAGSELIGSADFSNGKLAGCEVTTYRGAFDPSLPMHAQWTRGWTNFDPQNEDYSMGPVVSGADNTPSTTTALLGQNYPNPFNPSTVIPYFVPARGQVSLTVYDVSGAVVATLVDGVKSAGPYTAAFNAPKLSSGVYFYRLTGDGFSETRKMVLMK